MAGRVPGEVTAANWGLLPAQLVALSAGKPIDIYFGDELVLYTNFACVTEMAGFYTRVSYNSCRDRHCPKSTGREGGWDAMDWGTEYNLSVRPCDHWQNSFVDSRSQVL